MVTQKLGASKVDQSPDHSSFAPYRWRSRRCSSNVRALFQTTPSSTTPGRGAQLQSHRSAPWALMTAWSSMEICRSCWKLEDSGSRTAVGVCVGVDGRATGGADTVFVTGVLRPSRSVAG